MDTITLTHGAFRNKFLDYSLIQKTNPMKTCNLNNKIRLEGPKLTLSKNAKISVVHPQVQYLIGKWIIKVYERNGNAFKKPMTLVHLLQSLGRIEYVFPESMKTKYSEFSKKWKSSQLEIKLQNKVDVRSDESRVLLASRKVVSEVELECVEPDELEELIENCFGTSYDISTKGLILFELGIQGLEDHIHPAIALLSLHMSRVRISTVGLGLDYNHPYVNAMFMRPLPNLYFYGMSVDDIRKEFINKKGNIVLLGCDFAPSICSLARQYGIEVVRSEVKKEGSLVIIQGREKVCEYHFFSYLPKNVLEVALYQIFDTNNENTKRGFITTLLPTFIAIYPCPQPEMEHCDGSKYNIGISSTTRPFTPNNDATFMLTRWLSDVINDRDGRSTILGVVGRKGGLKSTVTKILIEKMNLKFGDKVENGFGRVDSDAYGKWVMEQKSSSQTGSISKSRTWAEFDRAQNSPNGVPYFEEFVSKILKGAKGDILKDKQYELQFLRENSVEIQEAFSSEFLQCLNDDVCGYSHFSSFIMSLDDLPQGLIWELHCSIEVAFMPATIHIFTIFPCYSTGPAVRARNRTSLGNEYSPLADVILHDMYARLCAGNVYTRIRVADICQAVGYDPVTAAGGVTF